MVRKKKELNEEELKKGARKHSIKEGIFATVRSSLGDNYISPFAIAINASNPMVAMFTAISGLLGPLSQTFGSGLLKKHSRKSILLKTVFFESLMWLPLIAIAILFYKGILTNLLPILMITFFGLYVIFANMGHPAWFSWMGDITDKKHRGRYFSKRNVLMTFVTVVLAIIASFFLDYFKSKEIVMLGFIIFFSLAFLARLISWHAFKTQYEPKVKIRKESYFSYWSFLKQAPKNNFGKFTLFRSTLGLVNGISGPLVAIYLLRYLEFSYSKYMIIILSASVFAIFVLELWGKFADRFGNYRTLLITAIFIPLTPILLILSPNPFYLIFVPRLVAGISWAGFNLATGNFIYDNVGKQKRGLAVSYFNLTWGIGVFIGAGISALLIKYVHTTWIEPLFLIFIVGTFARMIVVFFGLNSLKEVRKIKKFKGIKSMEDLVLKEAKPTITEEIHQILHIGKYLKA
jgi:MFS family permease